MREYIGLTDKNNTKVYIDDVITFKIRTGMSSNNYQKKVERDKDMIGVDMQDPNRLCYLVRVSSLDDVEVVGYA